MKLFWYMILGYFHQEHFSDGVNHASIVSADKVFYDVEFKQTINASSSSTKQDDRYWKFVYMVSAYINKHYNSPIHPKVILDPLEYNNARQKFKKIKERKWNWAGSYVIEKITN